MRPLRQPAVGASAFQFAELGIPLQQLIFELKASISALIWSVRNRTSKSSYIRLFSTCQNVSFVILRLLNCTTWRYPEVGMATDLQRGHASSLLIKQNTVFDGCVTFPITERVYCAQSLSCLSSHLYYMSRPSLLCI